MAIRPPSRRRVRCALDASEERKIPAENQGVTNHLNFLTPGVLESPHPIGNNGGVPLAEHAP